MLTFILRRIVALIPLLFIVSVIVFGLVLLVPGDAATRLAGGEDASPQNGSKKFATELGLDRPFVTQYVDWLEDAVTLDFGESLYSKQPVASEIWDRFPVTLQIAGGALVFGLLVGIPFGIISGMRPRGIGDRGVVIVTSLAIAIPSFWLAQILILNFARLPEHPPVAGLREVQRVAQRVVRAPPPAVDHARHAHGRDDCATAARRAGRRDVERPHPDEPVGRPALHQGRRQARAEELVGSRAHRRRPPGRVPASGARWSWSRSSVSPGWEPTCSLPCSRTISPQSRARCCSSRLLTVLVNLVVDISYAILNPKVRVE